MSALTEDQIAILAWMVESDQDPYILSEQHGSTGAIFVGSKSANLTVNWPT